MITAFFQTTDTLKDFFILKLESKREPLALLTSLNSTGFPTEDFFYRKQLRYRNRELQNDTHTEYKATVRNCEGIETFYVRGRSRNVYVVPLGEFNPPSVLKLSRTMKVMKWKFTTPF